MMKILFLLDSLGGGGFERRMTQLIYGLSIEKNYASIYVLLPHNAKIIRKEALEYNCRYRYYSSTIDIYRIFKEIHPDIIHCCSPVKSIVANIYRLFHKCIYIAGFVADANRPPLLSKKNWGYLLSYLFSDAVVSNSKAGLDAYRCPKSKSHVIYNGFDPQRLDVEMAKDLDDIRKKNKYVVSMVAAMRNDKDYIAYLNTANSMKENDDIVFLVAGLGPNEGELKEYSKKNNISNVIFLGYRMDVVNVFKISDVSVLLSNQAQHKEGVSNSIMESLAVGTPVIATMGGGTNEIIRNGIDGIIIDSNRADVVKEEITKILTDNELRNRMSIEGKKRIKIDFSLSLMIERYKELYNKI